MQPSHSGPAEIEFHVWTTRGRKVKTVLSAWTFRASGRGIDLPKKARRFLLASLRLWGYGTTPWDTAGVGKHCTESEFIHEPLIDERRHLISRIQKGATRETFYIFKHFYSHLFFCRNQEK